MHLTAEISMYPLDQNYEAPILEFIAVLKAQAGITIFTHSTATKINGSFDAVHAAIGKAMKHSSAQGIKSSIVIKYLNMDLPVDS